MVKSNTSIAKMPRASCLQNLDFVARIASVADAKRGGGRGEGVGGEREKSVKEEKREGSACFKSRCFCIPPTIF